jgi:capsular polysaccharide transport system ATP-binding protein
MLRVDNLAKTYPTVAGPRLIFEDLSFELGRNERLAILGRNGQGKSTLIKILGGVTPPTAGRVAWTMTNSWPLGFAGAFQGGMTGLDNIRFIARIYDRPIARTTALVEQFAELGDQLAEPVRFYSSGMRARLAFGLSLAIEFDCYLIDEVFAVGDALFREKCENELFRSRGDRAFVIASHDLDFIRSHCQRALVIERGRVKAFDDIGLAIDIYKSICDEGRLVAAHAAQSTRPAPSRGRWAAA